jgi:hypothetical protein
MRLSQEAYIDSVLAEEIIQFQIPVAKSVSYPADQPKGFLPFVFLGRVPYTGTKRTTVFRTACERFSHIGRVQVKVFMIGDLDK